MLKFLKWGLALTAVVGVVSFMGCETDPVGPEEGEVDITLGSLGSVQAGQFISVEGEVTGDPEVDAITYKILDASGSEVSTGISVSAQTITDESTVNLMDDAQVKINTTTEACNGSYQLEVTATSGDQTATKTAGFTVTGGQDCGEQTLTSVTVNLGSVANATLGSSLDADEMAAYTVGQLTDALKAEIDVWFSNGTFYSPSAAAATDDFAPKDWAVKNTTTFQKVNADFSSINTQSQIDALWTSGVSTLTLTTGDVIIIETNKGNHRMVKIESVDATAAGTAVVMGLK